MGKVEQWKADFDFVGIQELCEAAVKNGDLYRYLHINEDEIAFAVKKGIRSIPGIRIYQENKQG